MTSIGDAITLRNHIINILEQANLEEHNINLRKDLLTFIVVGGGFNGIETVGEVNHFVRDSIEKYYKNILMTDVRVLLVSASDKILEQVDEQLGKYALQKLKASGIEFIMSHHVKEATPTSATLDDGTKINTYTLVWSAGVTPTKLIKELDCEHDRGHRIVTNHYLEVPGYEGVYAIGDCASITNPHTGKPYPPTAQHAIPEAKTAAENIINSVKKGKDNDTDKKKFDYKTKGMMAQIGKRTGVATLFGTKVRGFTAWWLWRTYYWAQLPTTKKKLKVMGDWTSDLFFKPDVAMIKRHDIDTDKDESAYSENGQSKQTSIEGQIK
jgi:NADH dehydrogenase